VPSESVKRERMRDLFAAHQTDPARSLAALRAGSNFVPGVGSMSPRVVLVGEAPGGTEDRLRRPFCGPSGRVLDELLESVGWTREQVWITNCVKYRPDKENRDPTPEEKMASRPYLVRELAILGCPFIVALGKQPLSVFLGGTNVPRAQWRQVWFGPRPYWLLPLYHPAVGVYQRSKKQLLMNEFGLVRERLDTE
jgi:uracil-DNA glycosylase family 4